MPKIRSIILSLLAVFAVSAAVSASSASAVGWTVCKEVATGGEFKNHLCKEKGTTAENKWKDVELKAGETFGLAEKTKVSASKIRFHKNEIEMTCTEVTVQKGLIIGTNSNSAKSITFKKCTVNKPAGCELEGGEIKTSEIESVLNNTSTEVEFKPKGTTTFATFKLKGAACGLLAGAYSVKGTTVGKIAKSAECLPEHALEIKEAPSKLTVAGEAVGLFEQNIGLSLENGWCWDA